MGRIRIPLHVKVMFSYLVVIGLVLGPVLYESASQQLKRAGAIGLSAALILSAIAALSVSRPLRRIATLARAFAAGDFGQDLQVRSRDELGDAADALREMSVQLRAVLVEVGSGRATLQALLDELPCGVILYDAKGQPAVISARAREQCELTGAEETLRAAAIARFSEQEKARREALAHGRPTAAPLHLPWSPERALEARWLNVYSKEGRREQAIVISDTSVEQRYANLTRTLNGSVLLLREAARSVTDHDLRLNLEVEAERLEQWASWNEQDRGNITAVDLKELCSVAAQQMEARAELKKIKLRFDLPDVPTHVAESGGRTCRAVRGFLESAVRSSKKGSSLAIAGEVQNGCVRLSVRTKALDANLRDLEPLAAVAGGEIGSDEHGDIAVFWLTIPRA